jgi:glutamine amidotransferase
MCRMVGSVSRERTSLRHELLDAKQALLRDEGLKGSAWGKAVYQFGEGEQPDCLRFPEPPADPDTLEKALEAHGRIVTAHVRKPTVGGPTPENTQPFCLSEYTFCHSGTIGHYEQLLPRDGSGPRGDSDSERFFHRLLREIDPDPRLIVDGLRRGVTAAASCGPFSALNFFLSDGERLYAYRLGLFELHWLPREGQVLVASERVTDERWHDVRQDVLLVISPGDDEPHAERLLGDELLANVRFDTFDDGSAHAPVTAGQRAAAAHE